MAELCPSRVFQHGGGGYLRKWRRTPSFEFFGFSMSILVCVSNFIEIGQEMADLQRYNAICSLCMQFWGEKKSF
jgi:hypothetical protein